MLKIQWKAKVAKVYYGAVERTIKIKEESVRCSLLDTIPHAIIKRKGGTLSTQCCWSSLSPGPSPTEINVYFQLWRAGSRCSIGVLSASLWGVQTEARAQMQEETCFPTILCFLCLRNMGWFLAPAVSSVAVGIANVRSVTTGYCSRKPSTPFD